jgi:hypothetical protein
MVKQALQAPDYRLSAMGGLVHELKEPLCDDFADVRVVHIHIPRECNKVAHELARTGSLRRFAERVEVACTLKSCLKFAM